MTASYKEKKRFLSSIVSVYGRKPVLEVLQDRSINCQKLHLADSNKPAEIVKDILNLAQKRHIDVVYHDRKALSRISKNSKQDQGVVIDIYNPKMKAIEALGSASDPQMRFMLLDNITNPQNVGMIIRSVAASGVEGIIIPSQGTASLNALVVKSSAGTLFKAPIYRCDTTDQALSVFKERGADIAILAGEATESIFEYAHHRANEVLYVMGNESDGVSKVSREAATHRLMIPMENGVESLNVAVAAALVSFTE